MTYQAVATAAILTFSAAAALAGAGHHGHGQGARKAGVPAREQTAWGVAGDARGARTIEVTMTDDMRFTPQRIQVRQGDTIRFVVRNNGKMLHEMVLGTKASLEEHAALMVKFPGMEHDEPYMTHVKPGARQAIVWNFNRPGEFHYACLIAGHYQAGMVGTISVVPAGTTTARN
ncbi:cupredoxin family protein [Ramlibacter sp. RBP-2]|uniref:Cupredoxin family protein n=1 Tax=Ramlibacter lithotrophicus TaxID=2606681 RepID=A0A7X6DHV7_9BURK|nr:cupredoxin family protein [Ramlibacter lithotrophicus]NKE67469.1 cupredoxin family protein [Ramlibacter lithotrophicus]